MPRYVILKSLRIFGAPVHVHWSVFVVGTAIFIYAIKDPVSALIGIACYLAIILLHESGHAYASLRLGYQPLNIYLGFFHGLCEFEAPDNSRDECIIAWGGALAQLAVAIPLVLAGQFTSLAEYPVFAPIIGFLGYISVGTALFNLAPARGFDGKHAWRLFPILIAERRRLAKAKRRSQPAIRRVK